MRASIALAVVSALAVSARTVQKYSSSLDMTTDPNKVKIGTRATWCQAQTNTCGILCDNNPAKNECEQENLKYECTCASNNSMPGLQFYTQTMPTFICQKNFEICNEENVSDADAQAACKKNIQELCGKTNPPKSPVSSSTDGGDSSDTSSTRASTPTPNKDSASVSSSSSGGVAAPTMAPAGNGAAAAAAIGFLAYLL